MNFPKVQKAIEIATKLHADQWREGPDALPYITHPIEVLLNLRYVGGVTNQEMLCAAVLHDTVEETSVRFEVLEKEFGPVVRDLVQELTRKEPSPAEVEGLTKDEIWKLRAGMLVEEISKMSPDAQQIKLADRLSNIQDAYRTKRGDKLDRYKRQTKEILKVVPRERNQGLWDAIKAEL